MKPRTEERRQKSRTINELIGMNIREQRLLVKLTQRECSKLLAGACESYWRNIETGGKDMSLLRVVEVAEVLGCPVTKIMKGI